MPTNITCPNCGNQFDVENVLASDLEKKMQKEYQLKLSAEYSRIDIEKQKIEADRLLLAETKKRENEIFLEKLDKEKQKLKEETARENEIAKTTLQQELRKSISSDFENQLQIQKNTAAEFEEKLKAARLREAEFMKKEQELRSKAIDAEMEMQRKLQQEREAIANEIRRQEHEKAELKDTATKLRIAEMEKMIEDQKKLMEEARRKAEQGSMQTQGEVQELLLEDILRSSFPFDDVEEVSKGKRGADCMLIVRNKLGQECGKIIFESKRTKDFGGDWIDKLKADMLAQKADVALLVTQAFPKDMERFGEKDGIWICNFAEIKSVVAMLRSGILKVFAVTRNQENKGDKMHMLYDYLTSREFADQWQAMREGFISMKQSIQRERDAMERLWKAREKQLDKVLLNASHLQGSIEGIAGTDVSMHLLEDAAGETDD